MILIVLFLAQSLAPDAPGCVDSIILPKLQFCRVDNCEKKDADHRDLPVLDNGQGEPTTAPVDGDSHSTMYECREGATPASIINQAAAALKSAGFEVPYQFADQEGDLTARKADLWISVEAASRFYTLIEIKAASDLDSASDAIAMADAINHYGHVPANGIQFLSGKADLTPESVVALHEVAAMLVDNSDWRIRVVGHGDVNLSMLRATAVVNWLVVHGIKRARLEVAGDIKGNRLELVKLP